MRLRMITLSVLAALYHGLGPAAAADVGAELGAEEYRERCAICHGVEVDGDGPLARFFTLDVPGLSELSKDNGGVFPFEHVYRVIDGRTEVAAHGPRSMPVWGHEYRREALDQGDPTLRPIRAEFFVTERILSLIRYLESVQAK